MSRVPKQYIIFGNCDYKGWVWLFDSDSKVEIVRYIDRHLDNVPWQWVLTETIKLHGYEGESNV